MIDPDKTVLNLEEGEIAESNLSISSKGYIAQNVTVLEDRENHCHKNWRLHWES